MTSALVPAVAMLLFGVALFVAVSAAGPGEGR
jgi:hypothetical protein